jgi:DNA-binding IclR family transcriptional regulator
MDVHSQRSGSIQSVERAVAVLKLFGESEPELGVSDLARRLKLHKSTVSRLLSTLEAGGFVQQDPRNGRYRLGLQLATLAGLALTQYELRDIARGLLKELADLTGETTTLSVLDGTEAVNIDQVLSPQPVKHLGWIGRRLPLHCTAAGKPLLAHLPLAIQERYLGGTLTRYTARTLTNPSQLRRELEQIRTQGFALGVEEYEADLNAAGAAVRDYRGDVVASVTVSGPTFRLPPDRLLRLADAVRNTAARISAQLGHRPAGTAVLAAARRAELGAGAGTRTGGTATTETAAGGASAKGTAADGAGASGRRSGTERAGGRRPQMGVAGPVFGD